NPSRTTVKRHKVTNKPYTKNAPMPANTTRKGTTNKTSRDSSVKNEKGIAK
ncbi:hypothetical protein CHS0354_032603, partial [Potamilus streckersoni]